MSRIWRAALSAQEFNLLSYLFDNTIEWGRTEFDFTWEQVSAGVRAPEGSPWPWRLPPIGDMSRATFYRTMASLIAKGAILREATHRTCTKVWLSLVWAPVEGMMTMKLAISKKRKADLEREGTGDLFDGTPPLGLTVRRAGSQGETPSQQKGSQQKDPLYSEPSYHLSDRPAGEGGTPSSLPRPRRRVEIPERDHPVEPELRAMQGVPPAPVEPSPAEVVRGVMADSQARAAERLARARQQDTFSAYHATWRAGWEETYPGVPCPAWSQQDGFMMRAVMRRHYPQDVEARHAFLDWTVRNWRLVMVKQFGWMKSPPPEMPKVSFMVNAKIGGQFLDAFASRRKFERIEMLPGEEREIARMVERGMTREQALLEAGKRRAVSATTQGAAQAIATGAGSAIVQRDHARLVEAQKQLLRDKAAAAARGELPPPLPKVERRFNMSGGDTPRPMEKLDFRMRHDPEF